jgi:hypothetical protein
MGNFRNYKICDRCGCKIDDRFTTISMDKIAIEGEDHTYVDRASFDLCNPCGNAVYDLITTNPLPKFGDE